LFSRPEAADFKGGDLAPTIEAYLDRIPHIPISDKPGRHEPGSGEINYPFRFGHFDRLGYRGRIGCEYWLAGRTEEGLGWVKPYLLQIFLELGNPT